MVGISIDVWCTGTILEKGRNIRAVHRGLAVRQLSDLEFRGQAPPRLVSHTSPGFFPAGGVADDRCPMTTFRVLLNSR
jgi:hypothetical protein